MEDSSQLTTMVMDADLFEPDHHHILQYLRLFVLSPAHYAAEPLPIIRRDIYAQVPSLLFSGHLAHAKRLYFLTSLKTKFHTGRCDRKDRIVGNGYWHPQRTISVSDPAHQFHLGYMTMLNFFESSSRAPKPKSQWIMHEYTLPYPGINWAISCIYRTPHTTASVDDAAPAPPPNLVPNKGKRKAHHMEEEEEDPMSRSQRPRPSPAIPTPTTLSHDHSSALSTLLQGDHQPALDLSALHGDHQPALDLGALHGDHQPALDLGAHQDVTESLAELLAWYFGDQQPSPDPDQVQSILGH